MSDFETFYKSFSKQPREYQKSLFLLSHSKNSIVFMETGKGKTFLSIMIISKMLEKNPNSKIFFLVCETSLLKQQQDNIEHELNINVSKVGKIFKNASVFSETLKNSDVLVSTPAILHQCLCLGYVKISDINMLIFDECHHCDKDHPYSILMKEFQQFQKLEQYDFKENIKLPQILGLTASPVKQSFKDKDIKAATILTVQNLCISLDSQIIIDPEVKDFMKNYINDSKDLIDTNSDGLANLCENEADRSQYEVSSIEQSNSQNDIIRQLDNLFKNIYNLQLNETIKYKDEKSVDLNIIDVEKFFNLKLRSKNLKDQNDALLSNLHIYLYKRKSEFIEVIEDFNIDLFHIMENLDYFSIRAQIGDQLEQMKIKSDEKKSENQAKFQEILSSFFEKFKVIEQKSNRLKDLENFIIKGFNNPSLKSILFVQNRIVAKQLNSILNNVLNKIHPEYYSEYVIGVNSGSSEKLNNKINISELNERLANFNLNSNLKILIGTSTIEEGIDIKNCNMIICQTEIVVTKTFIQMKGRARQNNSKFIMFTYNEGKTKNQIQNFITSIIITRQLFEKDSLKYEPNNETKSKGQNKFRMDNNEFQFIPSTHAKLTINGVGMFFNSIEQKLKNSYNITLKFDECKTFKFNEKQKGNTNHFMFRTKIPKVLQNDCVHLESDQQIDKKSAKNHLMIKIIEILHKNKIIDDQFQVIKK